MMAVGSIGNIETRQVMEDIDTMHEQLAVRAKPLIHTVTVHRGTWPKRENLHVSLR